MVALVYDNKDFKSAIYERFNRNVPVGGNIIITGVNEQEDNSGYCLRRLISTVSSPVFFY